MSRIPPTHFTMVFTHEGTLAPGAQLQDQIEPKKPMRAGVIRYFTVEVFDPAFTDPTTHPDVFYQRVAAKIMIGGEPIGGTGRNDYIPLRSLIGDRSNPVLWDLAVPSDKAVTVELLSMDDDAATTPNLKAVLVAHLEDPRMRKAA